MHAAHCVWEIPHRKVQFVYFHLLPLLATEVLLLEVTGNTYLATEVILNRNSRRVSPLPAICCSCYQASDKVNSGCSEKKELASSAKAMADHTPNHTLPCRSSIDSFYYADMFSSSMSNMAKSDHLLVRLELLQNSLSYPCDICKPCGSKPVSLYASALTCVDISFPFCFLLTGK